MFGGVEVEVVVLTGTGGFVVGGGEPVVGGVPLLLGLVEVVVVDPTVSDVVVGLVGCSSPGK